MDVQTDNMDPPPCESQPSGKIRKGFKLFGKHKPGNIFSIRSKGDGNNKSPIRSKTLDGLSETAVPDSEHEPDKEKGQEVSQGEREQAEEEQLGEDGILAAAPARTSISSVSSAKSLSFLSLLRGGRRGVGDRRVQTVSQPVGRQRRGLKGLFGNVKFRAKDKDDKEEAPPSPLLMSSRASSVEIIKEDLTLTPKSQPRSLDSPETEPVKSLTQDSAATSPSEAITPQVTAGNVSRTNEHVSPLPTPELPLVPGDNSLSSLLADISSLLTFDSISGGGDIMADVEAEWGKASSAIGAVVTEVTPSSTSFFSKPTISSPIKLSPVAVSSLTVSSQSVTPQTKTTSTSSPTVTTLTKSSNLTTNSVKPSSDSTSASELSTSIKIKSTPTPPATKPSTTQVALTSLTAPVTSSPSLTIKTTLSSTSTTTTVKAPSISPTLTSTASKLASETAEPAKVVVSVSKPSPVATPTPFTAKPPPLTHSPATPVSVTQHPPSKLDSASSLQMSTSYKPILNSAGESKAPVTASPACSVITTPSPPALVTSSKMTTAKTSTTTADLLSAALCKPTIMSPPIELNKTPSLVTVPSTTPTTTTKTIHSPASVPTQSTTSLDMISCMTKPSPAPVALDKTSPAPTLAPVPTSHADISPPPPDLGQIPVSHYRAPPVPVQIPMSVMKDSSPPAQVQVYHSKASPAPTQKPDSVSKDIPVSAQILAPVTKDPPAPVQISSSVSKDPPVPAQSSVSVAKDRSAPTSATRPVTSLPCTSPLWSSEPSASFKTRGSGQAFVDGQLTSPTSTDSQRGQAVLSKTEEKHESRTSLQGSSKERRIPQVKASGLSKIPVVGGGRGGKLPVRDSQHADDETGKVPLSPVLQEERPHFNSHDAGNKDKIHDVEVNVPTSKHTPEESQQPPQPKVLASLPRDSKIPVKHSTQSHAASQIPQAKDPHRSKIPVSKVPVRQAGNKPAASGGSTQTRK